MDFPAPRSSRNRDGPHPLFVGMRASEILREGSGNPVTAYSTRPESSTTESAELTCEVVQRADWRFRLAYTGRRVGPSSIAGVGLCPLSFAKLRNWPARCARRILQVRCSFVGPVQWMRRVRRTYRYYLIVSDEYVRP